MGSDGGALDSKAWTWRTCGRRAGAQDGHEAKTRGGGQIWCAVSCAGEETPGRKGACPRRGKLLAWRAGTRGRRSLRSGAGWSV